MTLEKKNISELSIIEIIQYLWSKKKYILRITLIFFILGLFIAIDSDVEYESDCSLILNDQNANLNNLQSLSGLAGLAGINLSNGPTLNSISPDLYPEIINSYPFVIKTLNTQIDFLKPDSTFKLNYYFKNVYKPSLIRRTLIFVKYMPYEIQSIFFSQRKQEYNQNNLQDILNISRKDKILYDTFMNRLTIDYDDNTNIVTVTTKMPDKLAAAQLTKKVVDELTEYIISYKTERAVQYLNYVNDQYLTVKTNFEIAQNKLAIFSDQNKNTITAEAQIRKQKLTDEYNILYDAYKNLASELEQAKLNVKNQTPVFTIIDPVVIPLTKSEPKRKLILFVSLLMGVFISASYLTIKYLL